MDNLFGKDRVFTVPNLLSLLRLLMVPAIAALYRNDMTAAAAGLVILSALTDVADGMIARKYDQVTDLGKILDPIADKLTLGTLIFCLIPRYRGMILLLTLFLMRETVMAGLGLVVMRQREEVHSARWFGKGATAILYGVIFLLLINPAVPEKTVNLLLWGCAGMIGFAWLGYLRVYRALLFEMKKKS